MAAGKAQAGRRDFIARIPARLLKDPRLSGRAKGLWAILAAHADVKSRRTFVGGETLDRLMRCGRGAREADQRMLRKTGWLRVEWERDRGGLWSRRIYVLCDPGRCSFDRQRSEPTTVRQAPINDQDSLSVSMREKIISAQLSLLLDSRAAVPQEREDDLRRSLLDETQRAYPWCTPRMLAWALRRIAERAKTPPRSVAYFRRSLPIFFDNLGAEIESWLRDAAAERIRAPASVRLPDLVEDLKRLVAENDLPYDGDMVMRAVDAAEQQLKEQQRLQADLRVGRGPLA